MENDVSKTIEELKQHLGAETDADLARKLGVDRSTIASWKARGTVPERYLGILKGDSNQFFLTSPRKWGEHEEAAFSLALFRFTRLVAHKSSTWTYREYLELFSPGSPQAIVWPMMYQAQKDIAAEMDKYPGRWSPRTATAMLIRDEIEAGDAAIEKVRKSITIQGDWLRHFLGDS